MIAADPRLSTALKDVPKTDVLLDAIATGSTYYAQTGSALATSTPTTYNSGFRASSESYRPVAAILHRIGKVLVTGGSAPLVKPLIAGNPYFQIVPHSQLANCAGLLYRPGLHTPSLKVVA
jgi:hypothetical protein